MRRPALFVAVLWFLAISSPALAAETITYVDLVNRMIDLERLATLPAAGETAAQCSSWDRASRYDSATEKYIKWDANRDGDGLILKEGKNIVVAEMEGPGCLWRVWSANPKKGRVKIYLDGQEQPVVDLPFKDYFTGKQAPFDFPTLSYALPGRGWRGMGNGKNLYFPIPYQKSCKIVAEPGWGKYYHFTYTTFPKDTKVPTFTGRLTPEEADALKQADSFFANQLGNDPAGQRPGQQSVIKTVAAPAGKTTEVAKLAGPRAITAVKVNMDYFKDRKDEMAALRQLALQITFDGQQQPAVWCPLGDFFGTAPGENRYRSLPTGMTGEGYYAYWYMPFGTSAEVALVNDGPTDRQVQMEIVHAPLEKPMEQLGHFHCKWHRDVFPLSKDRWPDWVMLRTQGRGRFCGVMLHVWNPAGGWWGEGDEKFFVDGEKFPSTFGTGAEDYFGYAWGDPSLFETPYHCQTMTQNNKGHQSVLRWHIVDNVPFQESFEGCIEKYFGNERGTLFTCTPVWYLAPGGKDPFEPVAVAQRHDYYAPAPIFAGGHKIFNKSAGQVKTQKIRRRGGSRWYNNDQLWWTGAQPGDKLEISLTVEKDGIYNLSTTLTKANDYAIVQLYLDGQKLSQPIDLYNPEVIRTEPIPLGTHTLKSGQHRLTVELVGANPKAIKSYMFGLDQIEIEPVQ